MNQSIEQAIAAATQAGWQIVSRDPAGIQFRHPKTWNKGAVWLGVVLLLFWGFGLLVLLLAALDYALAKDRLVYATTADLEAGRGPGAIKAATPLLAKILAGIVAAVVLLAILGALLR